jgi:hypothetical protein
MIEQWKPIPEYRHLYEVSSEGRFRSRLTGKLLRPAVTHRTGYLTVKLYRDRVGKTYRAHRLVLTAFVGPCPADHVARHLNGKRTDNRLANLVWGTALENEADKKDHGTFRAHFLGKHGAANPMAKITDAGAMAIRALAPIWGQEILAQVWGVNQSSISNVVTGKTFRADATARAEMKL